MANATLILSVACYTFLFAAKDFPQEPRQVVYEIRPLPIYEIMPSAMPRVRRPLPPRGRAAGTGGLPCHHIERL